MKYIAVPLQHGDIVNLLNVKVPGYEIDVKETGEWCEVDSETVMIIVNTTDEVLPLEELQRRITGFQITEASRFLYFFKGGATHYQYESYDLICYGVYPDGFWSCLPGAIKEAIDEFKDGEKHL